MPSRRPPPRPLDTNRLQRTGLRTSVAHAPLRSAREGRLYQEEQSPLSPITPAILGTARLWSPTARLTPRMVDVAQPHTRSPLSGRSRSDRDYSPQSLADRRKPSYHQEAWVRRRSSPSPLFPFGLLSPILQIIIGVLILIASLITYLTLRQASHLAKSLQVTLVFLIILSTILLFHGLLRVCLDRKRRILLPDSHHRRRHHKHHHRRHHDHESRYQGPISPFDQLPPDDTIYSPVTPVRVHLLHDEEAFLGEKDVVEDETLQASAALPTPPPPAYGLWRCSVRADPNLLHWQRYEDGKDISSIDQEMVQRSDGIDRSEGAPRRPPSYHSDRGDEMREDDTGMSMEPGVFVEAVADDMTIRRTSMAVEEAGRLLRQQRMTM